MKELFNAVAADLQASLVEAMAAVESAVQSKADRVVILGHEEE